LAIQLSNDIRSMPELPADLPPLLGFVECFDRVHHSQQIIDILFKPCCVHCNEAKASNWVTIIY
jgi:hypothetical protein